MAYQNEEIEAFWNEQEEKLGEPILNRGLVHVIQSDHGDIPDDSWCIGMLTGSRFILLGGESNNWFSQMMNKGRKEKPAPRLELPRDILLEPEKITPRGFLNRLFNPVKIYRLCWKSGDDKPGMTIEMDASGEAFIQALP